MPKLPAGRVPDGAPVELDVGFAPLPLVGLAPPMSLEQSPSYWPPMPRLGPVLFW